MSSNKLLIEARSAHETMLMQQTRTRQLVKEQRKELQKKQAGLAARSRKSAFNTGEVLAAVDANGALARACVMWEHRKDLPGMKPLVTERAKLHGTLSKAGPEWDSLVTLILAENTDMLSQIFLFCHQSEAFRASNGFLESAACRARPGDMFAESRRVAMDPSFKQNLCNAITGAYIPMFSRIMSSVVTNTSAREANRDKAAECLHFHIFASVMTMFFALALQDSVLDEDWSPDTCLSPLPPSYVAKLNFFNRIEGAVSTLTSGAASPSADIRVAGTLVDRFVREGFGVRHLDLKDATSASFPTSPAKRSVPQLSPTPADESALDGASLSGPELARVLPSSTSAALLSPTQRVMIDTLRARPSPERLDLLMLSHRSDMSSGQVQEADNTDDYEDLVTQMLKPGRDALHKHLREKAVSETMTRAGAIVRGNVASIPDTRPPTPDTDPDCNENGTGDGRGADGIAGSKSRVGASGVHATSLHAEGSSLSMAQTVALTRESLGEAAAGGSRVGSASASSSKTGGNGTSRSGTGPVHDTTDPAAKHPSRQPSASTNRPSVGAPRTIAGQSLVPEIPPRAPSLHSALNVLVQHGSGYGGNTGTGSPLDPNIKGMYGSASEARLGLTKRQDPVESRRRSQPLLFPTIQNPNPRLHKFPVPAAVDKSVRMNRSSSVEYLPRPSALSGSQSSAELEGFEDYREDGPSGSVSLSAMSPSVASRGTVRGRSQASAPTRGPSAVASPTGLSVKSGSLAPLSTGLSSQHSPFEARHVRGAPRIDAAYRQTVKASRKPTVLVGRKDPPPKRRLPKTMLYSPMVLHQLGHTEIRGAFERANAHKIRIGFTSDPALAEACESAPGELLSHSMPHTRWDPGTSSLQPAAEKIPALAATTDLSMTKKVPGSMRDSDPLSRTCLSPDVHRARLREQFVDTFGSSASRQASSYGGDTPAFAFDGTGTFMTQGSEPLGSVGSDHRHRRADLEDDATASALVRSTTGLSSSVGFPDNHGGGVQEQNGRPQVVVSPYIANAAEVMKTKRRLQEQYSRDLQSTASDIEAFQMDAKRQQSQLREKKKAMLATREAEVAALASHLTKQTAEAFKVIERRIRQPHTSDELLEIDEVVVTSMRLRKLDRLERRRGAPLAPTGTLAASLKELENPGKGGDRNRDDADDHKGHVKRSDDDADGGRTKLLRSRRPDGAESSNPASSALDASRSDGASPSKSVISGRAPAGGRSPEGPSSGLVRPEDSVEDVAEQKQKVEEDIDRRLELFRRESEAKSQVTIGADPRMRRATAGPKWQLKEERALQYARSAGMGRAELRILAHALQQKKNTEELRAERQSVLDAAREQMLAFKQKNMLAKLDSNPFSPSSSSGHSAGRSPQAPDTSPKRVAGSERRWMPSAEEVTKMKIQGLLELQEAARRQVGDVETVYRRGDLAKAAGLDSFDFLKPVNPIDLQRELLAKTSDVI